MEKNNKIFSDNNSQRIILPIERPISSTYLVPASEFALLQTTETGMNYIYNRYIQLYMFENIINQKSYDVGLSILTDPFDHNPCFVSTKLESIHEFLVGDYKNMIIDSLSRNTYVYMYRYLDDYFLSETRFYKQSHMLHMYLIYGFDLGENCFYSLGYNKKRVFDKIRIYFSEFDESIQCLNENEHRYIILINSNNSYIEKFDTHKIKFWIDQYINSKNSRIIFKGVYDEVAITDKLVFGFNVHEYLLLYLYYFISNEAPISKFDFRFIRQLYEHKSLMYNRLQFLANKGFIPDNIATEYLTVLKNCEVLVKLNAKLLIKNDVEILELIRERVSRIFYDDKRILERVYNIL